MSTYEFKLIDTHAHLDEMENIEEIVFRAKENGVGAIIAMGQDYQSNDRVLGLAAKYKSFICPVDSIWRWIGG